mmetsp:Transcript_10467/g.38795  ORF Transcript_10467/g.38795 Transcript_10467/m.38795 type:complete len:346 (+) Transcript_10467:828-1865(+)
MLVNPSFTTSALATCASTRCPPLRAALRAAACRRLQNSNSNPSPAPSWWSKKSGYLPCCCRNNRMASFFEVSRGSACSAISGGKQLIGCTKPCRSTTSAKCNAFNRTAGSGSTQSSITKFQYRCATPLASELSCSPLTVWKPASFLGLLKPLFASARFASASRRRLARDNAPPVPAIVAAAALELVPPEPPPCAFASSDIMIIVLTSSSRKYSSRFKSACSLRFFSALGPSAARMIPSMLPLPNPPLGQSMSCGLVTNINPHACRAPRFRSNSFAETVRCRKTRNTRNKFEGDTACSRENSNVSAPKRAKWPSTKSARETCARSPTERVSFSETSSRSLTNRRQI